MKAALANLMRNLAKPAGPDGVTCNTILPGLIATDRSAEVQADPAAWAALLERIPCRREGTPREVAALALFLAGPMGGYVTGADLLVDGGLALP
jgi:NAD(P)-dependent dehydrogenase (short-subunit alcohol dehydrogenase family)